MKAIQVSQANFINNEIIDFSKNKKLAVLVNLIGVLSLPVFYIIFFYLIKIFSYGSSDNILYYWNSLTHQPVIYSLIFILLLIVVLVLHEFIHALFFYLFTGEKPVYGFKGVYGYAGSPGWYIKKNYYLIVSLSPFFIISLILTAVIVIFSPVYSSIIFILIITHAAGCIGDLWVSIKLLGKPESTYINDSGTSAVISY
jgi:hypothetical protein